MINRWKPAESKFDQFMEHQLREMASKDCVLSFRTSGPNYRTKQMASGDARDLSVTSQQIGTQSLKDVAMMWRVATSGYAEV